MNKSYSASRPPSPPPREHAVKYDYKMIVSDLHDARRFYGSIPSCFGLGTNSEALNECKRHEKHIEDAIDIIVDRMEREEKKKLEDDE